MSRTWRIHLLFATIAVCAYAADRITKFIMPGVLEGRPGQMITIIPGYFDFVISHNRGGAFGLFAGMNILLRYVPVLIVVAVLIFIMRNHQVTALAAAGLAMQLGGAAGNLIDRVRQGYVFDFIECHIHELRWPTYNVADICIVVGTALFAMSLLRGDFNEEETDAPAKKSKSKK